LKNKASCPTNNISFFRDFHLKVIWDNINYIDTIDYIERGCCSQGDAVCSAAQESGQFSPQSVPLSLPTTKPDSSSNNDTLSSGATAGVVIASIVAVGIILGLILIGRKRWRESKNQLTDFMKPSGCNPQPARVPSAPVIDD
jgi:hypothetical protein